MLRPGTASKRVVGIISRRNKPILPQVYSLNHHSTTMTSVKKSDSEWRATLSPEQVSLEFKLNVIHRLTIVFYQFRILRQKGTEAAGTGEYDKHYEAGVYTCAGCGTPLYKSATKFNVRIYLVDPSSI